MAKKKVTAPITIAPPKILLVEAKAYENPTTRASMLVAIERVIICFQE
jgi:hypothetical protein